MKTLIKTLSISLISVLISSPALAQFFYPSASFFAPHASRYRGGISPNPIQVIEDNDAQVFGFLLSTNNFEPELGTKENPVTILAPTDEAFAELSPKLREKLTDPVEMQKLLEYHLIPGQVAETDIKQGRIATLEGNNLKIAGKLLADKSTEIRLNDAIAIDSLRADDNTVIIIVDRVLLPPDLEKLDN